MRATRYFHLVERESSEVSIRWKISHLILFILLFIMSTLAAYSFSEIFDIFNFRCILYAKPVFVIEDIQFFNSSSPEETHVTIHLNPPREKRVKSKMLADEEPEIIFSKDNSGRIRQRTIDFDVWEESENIPNTSYYLIQKVLYFKNDSMYGRLSIKMMRTVFATLLMCDYVLFIPLLSMVVSSAFIGIVVLYGRGGRGYVADTVQQGWRYVYVMLVMSVILFILFIVAANLANNGLKQFCTRFASFTGTAKCNYYINYFTYQMRVGYSPFHTYYLMNYYAFVFCSILWAAKILLICLRILCITDFQFYTMVVKVRKKTDYEDIDEEDIEDWQETEAPTIYSVYQQLRHTTPGVSFQMDPEENKSLKD